jgi:hypothetical protein
MSSDFGCLEDENYTALHLSFNAQYNQKYPSQKISNQSTRQLAWMKQFNFLSPTMKNGVITILRQMYAQNKWVLAENFFMFPTEIRNLIYTTNTIENYQN